MPITVIETRIPDVKLIEPKVFGDDRGLFFESFNQRDFRESGLPEVEFVQDNHSLSTRQVLRGLHYQINQPQGKLVRVVAGEVFDVTVDLRRSSPTFKQWVGANLSATNKRQMWIPPGFAHGFLVLSEYAEFLYKATDFWRPEFERTLRWNDPDIGITWPLDGEPIMALKDSQGQLLANAETYE